MYQEILVIAVILLNRTVYTDITDSPLETVQEAVFFVKSPELNIYHHYGTSKNKFTGGNTKWKNLQNSY